MSMNVEAERLHKDLLALQAIMKRTFRRVLGGLDRIISRLDKIDGRLDHLDRGLRGLHSDMPKIVGDTMREVMNGKPRKK